MPEDETTLHIEAVGKVKPGKGKGPPHKRPDPPLEPIEPPPEPPPDNPQPLGAPSEWHHIFTDTFSTFDEARWQRRFPYGSNQVDESLTQLSEHGISLELARRAGVPHDTTYGVLCSREEYDHGFFECEMRTVEGSGLHPAFWLWSWSERLQNYWSEIDVGEWFGADIGKLNQFIHWGDFKPADPSIGDQRTYKAGAYLSGNWYEWHTYGCDYRSDCTDLWLDGQQVASLPEGRHLRGAMRIIFQLSVNRRVDDSLLDGTLDVRRVSYWQNEPNKILT